MCSMRPRTCFPLLAAAALAAACGTGDAPAQQAAGGDSGRDRREGRSSSEICRVDRKPQPLPDEIHEASGVAASRAHAGVFWTHNDSGDPVVYAVSADGSLAGQVRVSGAEVEDWEDIALAPCPDGDCLYVADIGDNQAERASVTVWRFPEPAPGDAESRPAEALVFRYPDGAQDAEALFVLPDGRIHVVTKGETGAITVYRAPAATPGGTATLERVRELAGSEVNRAERVTGASASADGRWVAVRTLRELAVYPADGLTGGGAAPEPRRMSLRELDEAQGEGVGFTPDGAVLLTSEGGKKKDPATFARLACTL
jgi:hypothetical protein